MRETLFAHRLNIFDGEISYIDSPYVISCPNNFSLLFPSSLMTWEGWVSLGKVWSVSCGMLWHGVVAVCGRLYRYHTVRLHHRTSNG